MSIMPSHSNPMPSSMGNSTPPQRGRGAGSGGNGRLGSARGIIGATAAPQREQNLAPGLDER